MLLLVKAEELLFLMQFTITIDCSGDSHTFPQKGTFKQINNYCTANDDCQFYVAKIIQPNDFANLGYTESAYYLGTHTKYNN